MNKMKLTTKQSAALKRLRCSAGQRWNRFSPTWMFESISATRRIMDALVTKGLVAESNGTYTYIGS